ncbi:MAG: hypothetical protein RR293_01590 [Bacteroidales bacterium]
MKKNVLENINRDSGMRVPDGYFDSLAERITRELPDVELPVEEPINLWKKIQPWLYMAAMFAGIALMFKIFSWNGNNENKTAELRNETHEYVETEMEEDVFFYDNVTDYAIYEYIAENN